MIPDGPIYLTTATEYEESVPLRLPAPAADRVGDDWVARRAGSNGVVSLNWQQVCLGQAAAGHSIDVHVGEQVLHLARDCHDPLAGPHRSTAGGSRSNCPIRLPSARA